MTITAQRPTDIERAMETLEDLAERAHPSDFGDGLLCSLTVLARVRDGLEPTVDIAALDFGMIRMNGFAPE